VIVGPAIGEARAMQEGENAPDKATTEAVAPAHLTRGVHW